MQPSTILIAGGTGLIGTRLAALLLAQGHRVRLLTRRPKSADQFSWDPSAGRIDKAALEGVDYIVNLAGAGIADRRWTPMRKRELIESRVQSAGLLRQAIEQSKTKPKAYLSASAIGYYGNSGEQWMLEDASPVDHGFMVECCQKWEQAADEIAALGVRTIKFRIGIVLAKEGGALAKILKPLKLGLGAFFGDGQAWWSWVHREDVCQAFIWAIETENAAGVYNLVAPNPVRGKDLVHAAARVMHQPAIFLPAPTFGLRLLFGEMSAVILNSNRISSDRLSAAGFEFQWPQLEQALENIL